MMEQRNLLLAIVLSVVILLSFQFLYEQPRMEREQAARDAAQQQTTTQTAPGADQSAPTAPGAASVPRTGAGGAAPVAAAPSRAEVVGESRRIRISTGRLNGSIALRGARIDDLTLSDYRETVDKDSKNITLLSPPRAPNPYYAQFGWVATDPAIKVPGPDTAWSSNHARLTAGNPVTLRWDNGEGLEFIQEIALDDGYMFTVTQRVRNGTGKPVTLRPYGLISRTGTPETLGFWILHEGLLGVFNDTLKEIDYDDVQDEGKIAQSSTGGWIGITDKFWLTALVPDQKTRTESRFLHAVERQADKYQVDFLAPDKTIQPGDSSERTNRLFAGAKEVRLLDRYRDEIGIVRFDLAVDWGWLWFLTKPIFQALDYFYRFTGNFGLAILLLTVLIKLAFFPLANKSYKAMSRMKKLQPKMMEIREKYKDDRARQNQEMMALYRTENANPMAGCFPILIQIPVFFALYKVLFVTIEMRHAPFYGWIQDLSAPDPLSILTLFGLIPWDIPPMLDIVNIGIWPIIMGGTMYLQQKLNPQPADPTQAKIFMMLPIVFTFILGRFPAGLVIYWAWNNLLSIAQQWVIMRRMGVSASGGTTAPAKGSASGSSSKTSKTKKAASAAGGAKRKPAAAEASAASKSGSAQQKKRSAKTGAAPTPGKRKRASAKSGKSGKSRKSSRPRSGKTG